MKPSVIPLNRTIWLNVLGRVEVALGEAGGAKPVQGQRAPAILALLGEKHSYPQEELVALLWSGESVIDADLAHRKSASNKFHQTMKTARSCLGPAAGHLKSRQFEVSLLVGPGPTGVNLRTDAMRLYQLAESNERQDLEDALRLVRGELGRGFPNDLTRSTLFLDANTRIRKAIEDILMKLYPDADNIRTRTKEVLGFGGALALRDWGSPNGQPPHYPEPSPRDRKQLFMRLRQIQQRQDFRDEPSLADLCNLAESEGSWPLRREVQRIRTLMVGANHEAAISFTGKRLQAALDVADIDVAVSIAKSIARYVDLIEVGDPLIRPHGLAAVERIHEVADNTPVVVEMVCSDWAGGHVEMAASAGADVIILMGCRTVAAVNQAVQAASRLRIPLIIDVPPDMMKASWAERIEKAGVAGISVIANLDSDPTTVTSIQRLRQLAKWTRLPLAVSGGFTADDFPRLNAEPWNIAIVGRGIFATSNPTASAQRIAHRIRSKE